MRGDPGNVRAQQPLPEGCSRTDTWLCILPPVTSTRCSLAAAPEDSPGCCMLYPWFAWGGPCVYPSAHLHPSPQPNSREQWGSHQQGWHWTQQRISDRKNVPEGTLTLVLILGPEGGVGLRLGVSHTDRVWPVGRDFSKCGHVGSQLPAPCLVSSAWSSCWAPFQLSLLRIRVGMLASVSPHQTLDPVRRYPAPSRGLAERGAW